MGRRFAVGSRRVDRNPLQKIVFTLGKKNNKLASMERWRDISGWKGFYQVSDQGRVRSVTRTIRCMGPHGKSGLRTYTGRVLSSALAGNGYKLVVLSRHSKFTYANVHRLVAAAFIGRKPRSRRIVTRHLNDDVLDNRACNLAYGTMSDNAEDRRRNLGKPGLRSRQHRKARRKQL
jgi:hypothetical protein